MNKIKRIILMLPVLAFMIISMTGCASKIPAGYSGIKVNMYGSEKGVDDVSLVTGRIWYNPMTTEIFKFPTFMQSIVWTKDKAEGSPNDESITFQTNDGLSIGADINLNFSFDATKVPQIFTRFRKQPSDIIDGYLRQQVRNIFVEVAGNYSVEKFITNRKSFLADVNKRAVDKFGQEGFIIDQVGIVGSPRLPKSVMQSIEDKIQATQLAQMKQRELQQAEADAKKLRIKAKGEADARIIEANGTAQANKRVAASLSKALITYEAIKKWNGIQPNVVGDNLGLILDMKDVK